MGIKCSDIIKKVEKFAPKNIAFDGDPIGLQLGDPNQDVNKLFLALELDDNVLQEAIDFGCQMIIVHHTPFFKPFNQLREDNLHNKLVIQMIRHNIALYTAHTNLDCVRGGVNDVLAKLLGISDIEILEPFSQTIKNAGLGRIGDLKKPQKLADYAKYIAKVLQTDNLRYCGDPNTIVTKVACCGGTGSFLIGTAVKKAADVFVTADLKHHEVQEALEKGLAMVDAGHFATERPIITVLSNYLQKELKAIEIRESSINTDPFIIQHLIE